MIGVKDLDREVLKYVKDDELLKVCMLNKKFWYEVCDDNFLRRRLSKYNIMNENESWKRIFAKFVHYTTKMKEEFNFEYSSGDFQKQYEVLLRNKNHNINDLLFQAVTLGELSLVIYSINKGANIHGGNILAWASLRGHLEIIKYFVDVGIDLHQAELAVVWASENGHLEVVKYLVEKGVNSYTTKQNSLKWARKKGHLDVVDYLTKI